MSTVVHDRRALARQLLLDHAAATDPERQAVRDTIALLDAPLDPFARTTLPGHVTGSAIVLDETRDRVLLVRHAALARWLQPGGHSEPGDESPYATALRELVEETGVTEAQIAGDDRLVHVDVHAIPARGTEPPHFHHDFRFAFTVASAVAPPGLDDGSLSWVRIDELSAIGGDDSLRAGVAGALRALR